jgi:redox-sensitive bicupin YhaK (pirin superfamily)
MKTVFHSEASRGHANHGWLNAKHSFSFASWQNPERVHFGALRVLNDDIVAPSMGFSKHPHDNMEIITIPLKGALKHQDSIGNSSVIEAGEVQVMSAGTGVQHSEVNAKHDEAINLFQIWIFSNKQNVTPRYDQIRYDEAALKNNFLQVVSPDSDDAGTWIHQDAWIHLSQIEAGTHLTYELKKSGNGVYILNIDGTYEIAELTLNNRDAIGIWETESVTIHANKSGRLLLIEVPMIF